MDAITQQVKQTKRPFVLISVMLAMFMGAVEATIVATAMPAIAADLGGFSSYSWVFSSYLLMNAVTVLIYGKLADIFGRKPVMTFGILVFLLGSVLCGFAESMTFLIVARFIQGFGAGAILPIATTIVGDIYTKEERAQIQGYLASVWGISAISGPAIGGLLVEFVTWRFVFWVNIPLGILSLLGIWFFLHEHIDKKERKIDYKGSILLTVSLSVIMYVLVEGGVRFEWVSLPVLGLFTFSFLLLFIFYFHEKRIQEPMVPFTLWKEKSILIANVVSLTTGVILMGLTSFIPTFVQGVMGYSPIIAGFTLTTMSIGWPIASTVAGRLLLKIGYRVTALSGGVSLVIGTTILVTLHSHSSPIMVAVGSFFVGVGMGLTTTSFIVSIQSTVNWEQRGIATASNVFMRNLGTTIGAALLGGILNSKIASYIHNSSVRGSENYTVDSTNLLLDVEKRSDLPQSIVEMLQEGLANGLHVVYIVVFSFALLSFVLLFLFPRDKRV
ncbi:MDR family MFS transporter [Bacillus carboniphilus]|uniref:MDR family MFS transporter n=1 Tax=Bacillus carboniphilus TaxID=86663 RepID=A0ABP3FUX0_9BACI